MDYFDVNVRGSTYLIKPELNGSDFYFTTDVDNTEVLFKSYGDGLTAVTTNADLNIELLEEIALSI